MIRHTITPDGAGVHEIRALRDYATNQRGACEMTRWLATVCDALEAGAEVTVTADMPRATLEDLARMAEFDHPFTVHADGRLTDAPRNVYAPEVFHVDGAAAPNDVEIGAGWRAWSTGYTGQHGYRGAVMHASEQLAGRIARDMLETPGTYVVTAVECRPVIPYPHEWSPSGARCVRTRINDAGELERCGVAGTGDPDDAPCELHPDFDPDTHAAEFDPDPEPAGWIVLELEHVNYPHWPGALYDCPACESRCHCTGEPGAAECIYPGPHVTPDTDTDGA